MIFVTEEPKVSQSPQKANESNYSPTVILGSPRQLAIISIFLTKICCLI